MTEISEATRNSIRKTVDDMARCAATPDGDWGGHKGLYLANLEGYLGRFPLGLLDALEEAEARIAELEERLVGVLDWGWAMPGFHIAEPVLAAQATLKEGGIDA